MHSGIEIHREVILETIPLYVRAGAILPLGPGKQYVAENVNQRLFLTIYPGADGCFSLFEDDGISFNYRKSEWRGFQRVWHDARFGQRFAHVATIEAGYPS